MTSAVPSGLPAALPLAGLVVIGRNEGERLLRCLRSRPPGLPCVYVDSGSTDGSVDAARFLGVEVVPLDLSRAFTAARARNAGWRRLLEAWPRLEYVAFVDGDCEIAPNWIALACARAQGDGRVVAVCGRRRERWPQASIFNRLCDIEWNTPVGDNVPAFGGDVVLRVSALRAAGGYRDDLVAGEEPELAVRLRARGGGIVRLDHDMTLHDAAILRWSQWWRRNLRSGHAFAEGAALHGAPPERHYVRETRRALAWGALLPATIVALAAVDPRALALLGLYPMQVLRLALRLRRARQPLPAVQSVFFVLGRFAEAAGVLGFHVRRRRGRPGTLIEYK